MDVVLVDFDPEPGVLRQGDVAALVLEGRRVGDVVQQVVALIVMNVETLFLNERVRRAGVDLDERRQRNRSEWAVGHQRHVVGFGHARDLVDSCGS